MRRFVCSIALVLVACLFSERLHAQEQPETPQELVALGDEMLARGDDAEAAEAYRQAVRLDEALLSAYLGLARVALRQEQWAEATDRAEQALRQDPDSKAAHYYLAISHRERAKFRTLAQRLHWTGAAEHFEWILKRDSLYEDVLYQYALLRSYHEAFDEALRLGHAQIRLRPGLDGPWQGLFAMYRRFLHFTRPEKALTWLRQHPSDFADYFAGEVLRRRGSLEEADAAFEALLARPSDLPRQPVLLSRARVHYAQDDSEEAQAFVEQAIREIDRKLEADLVLEDFKYLLSEEELSQYRALETPEEFRAFFEAFWEKRDPMPARRLNVRLEEHYKRLHEAEKDYAFYGFRTWHNNPDRLGELDFTEAYGLNREFNDRGLVYIRHGEPDDRVTAVIGAPAMNESWRYYGSPALDFHFERGEGGGPNNWRLTPRPYLGGRDMWGGDYARRARTQLEALETRRRIADTSRDHVMLGLTTERHTWPDDVEPLDFPHMLAAFRGEDGRAWLEIHYALPVDVIVENVADSAGRLDVEVGYAVHDTTWRLVAEDTVVRHLGAGQDSALATTDFFRLAVPPDSFHVALHSRSLQQANLLGGYRLTHSTADFGRPGLSMSDLLPARSVRPAEGPDRFERGGLEVLPNPSRSSSIRDPLHVYFEIYDLTPGANGQTRFAMEYTLTPEEGRRGFLGLFSSDRPVLTLKTMRAGPDVSPVEHAEIDVTKVDPGRYTLTVRVTDEHAGTTASRSRPIELTK